MIDRKNFYINGQWVNPKSKEEIKVVNPATEQDCAVIALANKDDVNDAVVAAKNAYDTWAFTPKEERIQLLEKLYESYKKRWNDIAEAITMEMGAPKDFSTKLQAGTGAAHIKSFIKYLKNFEFEKPLELAPLSSMILAELIDEVKFPAGVFNLINGDGATTGDALTSHPDINMISFTGSTRAGALISQNAAKDFKRVSLELGGKGANIIFKDADPEAIERGALRC